jgi:hypothetical protein
VKGKRAAVTFWVLSAAMSVQFALTYIGTLTPAFSYSDYAKAAVGYPFRRRVLMEWIYQFVLSHGEHIHYNSSNSHLGLLPIFGTVFTAAAMMLAIAAAKRWIELVVGSNSIWAWCALLVVWMANYHFLLVSEIRVQTPYDVLSMAMFGLACYMAYVQNRWLYYPVFILASLNRESTLFLPLVFLVCGMTGEGSILQAIKKVRLAQWVETAIQLGVWAAILRWCILTTGGMEPQQSLLAQNFHMLSNPLHWSTYASVFGFLWIPYMLWFVRIGDVKLRRIAWLALPWAIVMLKYADPLEIRTNSEWIVYVAVCLAAIAKHSFVQRTGIEDRPFTL